MTDSKTLEKYLGKCPFAVLTQIAMRATIADDFEQIFQDCSDRQYERELSFSALATAVADVVLRFAPNFHQSYKSHREELKVSLTSFYNKINGTDIGVSEEIVSRSAERTVALQDQFQFQPWEILKGYRAFALDGNHLSETDKRLKPLRLLHDAPLPGTIVARFDLQRQLFDKVYLLEDAHAQESSALEHVVADLEARDLIIADRHYCVLAFLQNIADKLGFFIIRQHGRFKGKLVETRRQIGRTSTGMVYEQTLKTSDVPAAFTMRRITVELDKPTRDGDTEIHLLTNLAADVSATDIADAYRHRWEEETAFYYLTTTLTCEVAAIGHPKAALFLFSMATMAFNVRQVMFAALYAQHDEEVVNEVSHHAISVEVARYTDGMLVVLDELYWQRLLRGTLVEIADLLQACSRQIDLKCYLKSKRGPKKPVVKPPPTRPKTHVSTDKILRKSTEKSP